MSRLLPNGPSLSQSNCGSNNSNSNCSNNGCGCNDDIVNNVFRDGALHKLNKYDDICIAYEKINANFKMLADGFYLLGQAIIGKEEVTFGFNIPKYSRGNLFFSTRTQKLYVWSHIECKYIPAYGAGSVNTENCDDEIQEYCPDTTFIPTLENLRDISEGRSINLSFSNQSSNNIDGIQSVTFVDSEPNCFVGLFIMDKEDVALKIWSPSDNAYVPAYGPSSIIDPAAHLVPTTTGKVSEKLDAENCDEFVQK